MFFSTPKLNYLVPFLNASRENQNTVENLYLEVDSETDSLSITISILKFAYFDVYAVFVIVTH